MDSVAQPIAMAIMNGFDRHYHLFRESCGLAKARFERADWLGVQKAVRERIGFYDERVRECVDRLHREYDAESIDKLTWQQVKLYYTGLLMSHKQPELAETFFNSVVCRILHRRYFNNDFIFVRPAASTEYIESDPPTYRSYYPSEHGLRQTIEKLLEEIGWELPFSDLARDVGCLMHAVRSHLGDWPRAEANCQLQVLSSPFYRNKGAYVIGKAINGNQEYPFAIAVLHEEGGGLALDAILLDAWRIGLLFSLNRAYFMADMEVPSGYVQFLRSILPGKPRSELYTMLGLQKQGKTLFYRDLMHHLRHSNDSFIIAPGIPGLVMLVFTLPSYPYVFKVIRDEFGAGKDSDRATVKSKYQLVKQVDRVGRLADTLEFSDVALPKSRISPELMSALLAHVPSSLESQDDDLIIRHLYIERRMTPLNLYLGQANDVQLEHAVKEYGNAIRELACANIFPGDMLWKNFGVTRYGRVVFYDYDEIEYLTDCNFRHIPEAPNPDMELSAEVWYSVAKNDIFPEEFATFLLGSDRVRSVFMKHHADLLRPEFWLRTQDRLRSGYIEDFFPYPEELRFLQQRMTRSQSVKTS